MKKLASILVTSLVATLALGQSFIASTYVEKTSVSPKTGFSIGIENDYNIGYGAFYQESKLAEAAFMSQDERNNLPKRYEKVFYGLYLSVPVADYYRGSLVANIRTGVANGESFIITPSLLANYELTNTLSIGGGLGVRSFAPTFQTSISINL